MIGQKIEFVGRIKVGSKKELIRSLGNGDGRRIGNLTLISDEEVLLFKENGFKKNRRILSINHGEK